jgi:hypothetical protein
VRYAENLENPQNYCLGAGSSQTPASCHLLIRRQAVCPDPQPTFGHVSPAADGVGHEQDLFARGPVSDA